MKAAKLSYFLIFCLLQIAIQVYAQQSHLSRAVNHLSEFISSDYFTELKKSITDLDLTDTIYFRALNYNEGDYSEALLALTFATIPYREVPVVIPIINETIYYSLISADEKIFNKKNENLPRYLFYDSPDNDYGDKDKLAHFFGNAFIGYSENILDLSHLIGYFVESFEEDFKAQSRADFRDIDVNYYGDLFGKLLDEDNKIPPSNVLLIRSLRFTIITL